MIKVKGEPSLTESVDAEYLDRGQAVLRPCKVMHWVVESYKYT